ncbi:MAG: MFS transporter [Syntrophales bacterium]|nr:MFS transporter [Syntrophales bacterium]
MRDFKTYRWYLLGIIALLYFFVCLHRLAPTVIARDLILSLKTDSFLLGLISSAYFYLYSAMQPLVGILTDTTGPRRVIISSYLIAGVGSCIFGLATTPAMALAGRALVGFGMAGVFIPALKLFSNWYAPHRFSVLTGLMLTVGGLGGISASLPLAYLVEITGWRMSFLILGGASVLLTALSFLLIYDTPEEKGWPSPAKSIPSPRSTNSVSILSVIRKPDFWMVFFSTFFTGGVSLTFQGLWCVPYLMDVLGLSRLQAGWLLMLLPLGFAIGGPLFSFLSEQFKLDPQKVIIFALTVSLGLWSSFLFLSRGTNLISIAPLFFSLGLIAGGVLPLYFKIIRDLFPPSLLGRATGAMNTAAFIGAAIYQPLSGYLLDISGEQFRYPTLFIFFLFSQLTALIISVFIRKEDKRHLKD